MKKILLYFSAVLCTVSCVSLSEVQTYPDAKIDLADGYLVQKQGEVNVALCASLVQQYRNTHTGIRFEPLFDDGTNKMELPCFVVEGAFHETFNDRMLTFTPDGYDGASLRKRYGKNGSEALYTVSVPYREWMGEAALYAEVYANAYTREEYLGRIVIANGLLDLMSLAEFTPYMNYQTYPDPACMHERRIIEDLKAVYEFAPDSVLFAFDSSDIPLAAETADSFREYIQTLQEDPAVKNFKVSVYVSNSPEGTLFYNTALGQRRLDTLLGLVAQAGIPVSAVKTKVLAEDWDSVQEALSGLGLAHRNEIAEIIGNYSDPDQREAAIRTGYPADFQIIADKVYPGLRKGRITVIAEYGGGQQRITESTFSETGYTISELVRSHQGDQVIEHLNKQMLSAVTQGDEQGALQAADRIPNISLPEAVRYNKALVLIGGGRLREAKSLLKDIESIPGASYNLGLLQLWDGEYECAAQNLDGFSDINSAIAKLYVMQNERAVDILHLQSASPERDYLLAIAYARLKYNEQAVRLLASATTASPTLAEKAKREPDFATLDNTFTFKPQLK